MQWDSGKLGFIEDAAKRMHETVTVLRDRATKLEEGLRESTATVEQGLRARAVGAGATNPDLAAVQASIRSGIAYIRENPVPATLLALGAGVIVTTIWNERNPRSGRRSRRRR
jgi:hypothetical protein